MTELYLVRHGETEWSRNGQHTSTTELDLTEEGVRQARAVAGALRGLQFGMVLSSPRLRARRTADLAGFTGRYAVDANLAEWNYGDYEGRTSAEIRQQVPDWRIWTGAVPGGESGPQVMSRLQAVVRRVRGSGVPRALCFAHGHSLRVLTLAWLGLDVRQGGHFPLETGTVSVLGTEKETPAILRWNMPPQGR
ncbi:histidine phosphatase family protein [Granulicoccus sp. GXG6511]|uniref:histidine phosphatase family protein n=1 Tax=Granulicoccus sp. GXG6511 TaxID=3381351 RepID=UPI003D7C6951